VGASRNWNQYCGDDGDEDANAEDVLASVACGEPATRHLGDDVSVEERAEDETSHLFAPFQLTLIINIVRNTCASH